MQVAAYARVSTQRQVQAQTTEQQLERLRAHAAAQGWALASEHVFVTMAIAVRASGVRAWTACAMQQRARVWTVS